MNVAFEKRRQLAKQNKKEVRRMTNLTELKNYDEARLQLEDLLHLDATAKATLASYTDHQVDAPDWLIVTLRKLRTDIKNRNRDVLEKKLSEARARQAQFKTTEEKRAEAAAEVAKLSSLLNG